MIARFYQSSTGDALILTAEKGPMIFWAWSIFDRGCTVDGYTYLMGLACSTATEIANGVTPDHTWNVGEFEVDDLYLIGTVDSDGYHAKVSTKGYCPEIISLFGGMK